MADELAIPKGGVDPNQQHKPRGTFVPKRTGKWEPDAPLAKIDKNGGRTYLTYMTKNEKGEIEKKANTIIPQGAFVVGKNLVAANIVENPLGFEFQPVGLWWNRVLFFNSADITKHQAPVAQWYAPDFNPQRPFCSSDDSKVVCPRQPAYYKHYNPSGICSKKTCPLANKISSLVMPVYDPETDQLTGESIDILNGMEVKCTLQINLYGFLEGYYTEPVRLVFSRSNYKAGQNCSDHIMALESAGKPIYATKFVLKAQKVRGQGFDYFKFNEKLDYLDNFDNWDTLGSWANRIRDNINKRIGVIGPNKQLTAPSQADKDPSTYHPPGITDPVIEGTVVATSDDDEPPF